MALRFRESLGYGGGGVVHLDGQMRNLSFCGDVKMAIWTRVQALILGSMVALPLSAQNALPLADNLPLMTVPTSALLAPDYDAGTPSGEGNTFLYRLIHRLIPDPDRDPSPAPDINMPGPDTANFPNSPFTLPKGRAYIETSPFSYSQAGNNSAQTWNWSFLLRVGLTDNVELRLFSNGPTVSWPSGNQPGNQGMTPLGFDLKIHLWGEKEWQWTPIVGLEIYLLTDMASQEFRSGLQPGISLLVDHNLPWDLLFEWNVGVSGQNMPGDRDKSLLYIGVQWAIQKQLTDKVGVFYQGFYNTADLPFFNSDLASGVGVQWNLTDRTSLFGSWNWTLDSMGNPSFGQAGFAIAF